MVGSAVCFRVVQEPHGWAVRMGEGMMTPFQSQLLAIKHATGFADALRTCGEPAEVVVEDARPPAVQPAPHSRFRPRRRPY
jgi:hypothetical protein